MVNTHQRDIQTISIYLKPTYSVVMPTPRGRSGPMTELQKENMRNLEHNNQQGKLSQKAQKKLVNSVNWLLAAAKKKYIWCKETNRRYNFKVNFITLTLPTTEHCISDHFFKKVLLHTFINTCRYKYGLKNYVWKVEAQANGNIHVHFTTDTFMNHKGVRKVWNRILEKNGLIDAYHKKHSRMNLAEYIVRNKMISNADEETLIRRYKQGVADNWTNPNSTDVKAVNKIADIGAYMAKYMSKSDDDRRQIQGRLWGCSYNISQANKLSIEIPVEADSSVIDCLIKSGLEYKCITRKDKLTSQELPVCDLYFYKLSDWGTKIKGKLLKIYNDTLFNIRHCIDVDALFSNPLDNIKLPENLSQYIKPKVNLEGKQTYFNL